MLRSLFAVAVLVLPLSLLSACGGDKAQPLNDSGAHRPEQEGSNNTAEPANCELPGSSFGIVGGNTLASGNILSESTVLIVHAYSKDAKQESVCTGTLIDNDKVLTAAHCVEKGGAGKTVVAFSNNSQCASKAPIRTLRIVTEQKIHPSYQYGGAPLDNAASDLAILKFSGEIAPGYQVRELPSSFYAPGDSSEFIMSGYGKTDENSPESAGTLRFTTAPRQRLSSSFYYAREERNFQLQGVLVMDQPKNGVCSGDSGGPLYAKENGNLVLIGIASAGVDNRSPRYAFRTRVCHGVSLFVDIRSQLHWINETLRAL